MRGISDDDFDRDVVGENFAIGIGDDTAVGVDRLLVNVFLGRQPGVLVVLNELQINEAKREPAKKKDKTNANKCTPSPTVPSHLPTWSFATGRMAFSSGAGRTGASRTMFCSVIGIILR